MQDALKLYRFISQLKTKATDGGNTPYNRDTFIRHAEVNSGKLKKLITIASCCPEYHGISIAASLLFWVYRGSAATELKSPIELPHICKLPSPEGEQFFVTTKSEWAAHRHATIKTSKQTQVSDHAKLQYLSRVLGINVDDMLSGFPKVNGSCDTLEDGRQAYTVGNHTYIYDDNVCVTILSKNMVVI